MIEIWHPQVQHGADSRLAYDGIYTDAGIHLLDSFYIWLLSLIQPPSGANLLDVSCGEGALVMWARRRGVAACGVDFSRAAIRRACATTGQPSFTVGDGARLPFSTAQFDYVTCIGSLEHFEQPALGIREIQRTLRPEGKACILLPNTFSLLGTVNYARKTGEIFDDGQPIQRYNTRMGWARLLAENGLPVYRVEKYELPWPQTAVDWRWYLRRPRKLAHLLVGMMLPINLANCHVFLCSRGSF